MSVSLAWQTNETLASMYDRSYCLYEDLQCGQSTPHGNYTNKNASDIFGHSVSVEIVSNFNLFRDSGDKM